jgi:hypothetical protein
MAFSTPTTPTPIVISFATRIRQLIVNCTPRVHLSDLANCSLIKQTPRVAETPSLKDS